MKTHKVLNILVLLLLSTSTLVAVSGQISGIIDDDVPGITNQLVNGDFEGTDGTHNFHGAKNGTHKSTKAVNLTDEGVDVGESVVGLVEFDVKPGVSLVDFQSLSLDYATTFPEVLRPNYTLNFYMELDATGNGQGDDPGDACFHAYWLSPAPGGILDTDGEWTTHAWSAAAVGALTHEGCYGSDIVDPALTSDLPTDVVAVGPLALFMANNTGSAEWNITEVGVQLVWNRAGAPWPSTDPFWMDNVVLSGASTDDARATVSDSDGTWADFDGFDEDSNGLAITSNETGHFTINVTVHRETQAGWGHDAEGAEWLLAIQRIDCGGLDVVPPVDAQANCADGTKDSFNSEFQPVGQDGNLTFSVHVNDLPEYPAGEDEPRYHLMINNSNDELQNYSVLADKAGESAVGPLAGDMLESPFTPVEFIHMDQPPKADAGTDQMVDEGVNVTLDGYCKDLEADVVSCTWEQMDGPEVTLTDQTNSAPDNQTMNFTAPEIHENTTLVFTLTATDGNGESDSDSVKVNVTQVNKAPDAPVVPTGTGYLEVEETGKLVLTINSTDPDAGDTLSLSQENDTNGGVFQAEGNGNGTFTWTTTYDDNGTYFANFTVKDAVGATNWTNVTINVVNVNRAPDLAAIGNQNVVNGTDLNLTLSATDADNDLDEFNFTTNSSAAQDTLEFTGGTAWFNWTEGDANVGDSFWVNVTVNDTTGAEDFENFTVAVVAPDTAPVLAAIDNQNVVNGTDLNLTLTATDVNDDLDEFSFTSDYVGDNMSLEFIGGAAWFNFTEGDANVGDSFWVNVTVNDTTGAEDFENFTVAVVAPDTAPVLAAIDNQNVVNGTDLNLTLTATDVNDDLDEFSFTSDYVGDNMSLEFIGGAAWFNFTEGDANVGDSFWVNVTVNDTTGAEDFENFTVAVVAPDTAPVLAAIDNQNVVNGTDLNLTLTATDVNDDLDEFSFTSDYVGDNMSLEFIGGAAWFNFTEGDANVGDSFWVNVTVNDTTGAEDFENFTVAVVAPDTAPVLAAIGDQEVVNGMDLNLTLTATDVNDDLDEFYFTTNSSAAQDALEFTGGNAWFNWTEGDANVGDSFWFNFTVNDTTGAEDFENFTVTVVAPDTAPVLAAIGDQEVVNGMDLNLTLTATDVNDDLDEFYFTTNSSAAQDALEFTGGNAWFNWTEGDANVGDSFWFNFTVNDTTGAEDYENITVTVIAPDDNTDDNTDGSNPDNTNTGNTNSGSRNSGSSPRDSDISDDGERQPSSSERDSIANAGIEVDSRTAVFLDLDGDGVIDSFESGSGRVKTAQNIGTLGVLVIEDTESGALAVFDTNTGEAAPVKAIATADTQVGGLIRAADVAAAEGQVEDMLSVTVPKESGWIHIVIDDPAPGQQLSSLTRSDGVVLELDQAWRSGDGKLHVIDDPDTTYNLGFEPTPTTDSEPASGSTSSVWTWVGVAIGVSLLVFIGAFVVVLRARRH